MRKLRQSVHRVERRGWEITVHDGRAIDAELEAEIDALEDAWRRSQRAAARLRHGHGRLRAELRPDDLYVLARSPGGRARAR